MQMLSKAEPDLQKAIKWEQRKNSGKMETSDNEKNKGATWLSSTDSFHT